MSNHSCFNPIEIISDSDPELDIDLSRWCHRDTLNANEFPIKNFIITPNGFVDKRKIPLRSMKKQERNKPCICGSGKKYKKCHGKDK